MHLLILKNHQLRKAEVARADGEPKIFATPEEAAEFGNNIMASSPGTFESFHTMSVTNFIDMMARKFEINDERKHK